VCGDNLLYPACTDVVCLLHPHTPTCFMLANTKGHTHTHTHKHTHTHIHTHTQGCLCGWGVGYRKSLCNNSVLIIRWSLSGWPSRMKCGTGVSAVNRRPEAHHG